MTKVSQRVEEPQSAVEFDQGYHESPDLSQGHTFLWHSLEAFHANLSRAAQLPVLSLADRDLKTSAALGHVMD